MPARPPYPVYSGHEHIWFTRHCTTQSTRSSYLSFGSINGIPFALLTRTSFDQRQFIRTEIRKIHGPIHSLVNSCDDPGRSTPGRAKNYHARLSRSIDPETQGSDKVAGTKNEVRSTTNTKSKEPYRCDRARAKPYGFLALQELQDAPKSEAAASPRGKSDRSRCGTRQRKGKVEVSYSESIEKPTTLSFSAKEKTASIERRRKLQLAPWTEGILSKHPFTWAFLT